MGFTPACGLLSWPFQVRAREFHGFEDRTRLASSTWTYSSGAGLIYPLPANIRVGAGIFYSPLWIRRPGQSEDHLDGAFNVRSLVTYRWR